MGTILNIINIRMLPVSYIYNSKMSNFVLSEEHPMKPIRLRMANTLIEDFQLTAHMNMFTGKIATKAEICEFHNPDYIQYLKNWVTSDISTFSHDKAIKKNHSKLEECEKYNELFKVNESFDCPGFKGLYNFCKLAVGSSLDAADLIITGTSHFAINWGGGFHHARKSEASGFCYVNDIVICILQLLKYYQRVLYVDIDVHHGDGVEEAFYHTNRVMTVSFHQFGDEFFPQTGELWSIGEGAGKYYSVNVPLKKGITDEFYLEIYKKVIATTFDFYHPDVIVLQSGADSLSKDFIGHLQLSIKAYGECLDFLKRFNTPMIVLGGGGYTIENVARCWTYETAVLLGHNIGNDIPKKNKFYEKYKEDNYKLHFPLSQSQNLNTTKDLEHIFRSIRENFREAEGRPSVPFHNPPQILRKWEKEKDVRMEEEDSCERIKPWNCG